MDILTRYRDNQSSSSEDDSEDSDNECAVWKRAKPKTTNSNAILPNEEVDKKPSISLNVEKEEIAQPLEQPKPNLKRKRNTIWCDVLQDQLISEDLEDCLLKNKPRDYGDRGKESYDYRLKYSDEARRNDSDSEMSSCSLNEDSGSDAKSKSKKMRFSIQKNKKFVKLNTAELEAARKINKVLNEKKYYLIQRIVKYAGIEKAMHYLELTKEIEDKGGMLIKSQSRRRTPGGVYIQVLKDDKEITQEVLDKIFEGELSGVELKKYLKEKKKNRKRLEKKFKNASKQMANADVEQMEPDEMAPMDSDMTIEEKPDQTSLDIIAAMPVSEKIPLDKTSDLEEGEIED